MTTTPVYKNQDQEYLPRMTVKDYERLEKEEREAGLPVTLRPPGWDKVVETSNSDLKDRVAIEDPSKSSCCPCPNWFFGRNTKEKTD